MLLHILGTFSQGRLFFHIFVGQKFRGLKQEKLRNMIRLHENWILHSSSPTKFCDTLVQGNVIITNITLSLTLVLNKPNVPFFSTYYNGTKIATAFKCIFEE